MKTYMAKNNAGNGSSTHTKLHQTIDQPRQLRTESRIQATNLMGFIMVRGRAGFITRSMGKLIPKLSASVKASLRRPDHCLLIFPTSVLPSGDKTLNSTSPQMLNVQTGPSIRKATSPFASLIENCGVQSDLKYRRRG